MRGLWVPLVTFIFAAILSGSARLQVVLQLDSSLASVLQESLVLVVLLLNGLRQRFASRSTVVPEASGGEKPQPYPEPKAPEALSHE